MYPNFPDTFIFEGCQCDIGFRHADNAPAEPVFYWHIHPDKPPLEVRQKDVLHAYIMRDAAGRHYEQNIRDYAQKMTAPDFRTEHYDRAIYARLGEEARQQIRLASSIDPSQSITTIITPLIKTIKKGETHEVHKGWMTPNGPVLDMRNLYRNGSLPPDGYLHIVSKSTYLKPSEHSAGLHRIHEAKPWGEFNPALGNTLNHYALKVGAPSLAQHLAQRQTQASTTVKAKITP